MGKPVLIKDKKQEVFDKANSTSKGRKLIGKIELWKDSADNLLKLQDEIQELAKEAGLSVEDTRILAQIVCDKVPWSSWYKKRFMQVFSPTFKEPDYEKLANKALMQDPTKTPSDKEIYEGDYILKWKFKAVSKKMLLSIARASELEFDMLIRDGKLCNARAEGEENWIVPEDYEVLADLTRKELEAQIN
jgi:hypothetical protein